MTKADKARALIEKYPTLSKKKLGELLYKYHPTHFKDAEEGRVYIRAVTGGCRSVRLKETHKEFYISHNLPEGKKNDYTPFIVSGKNIGILFDIHIPYHDKRAIELALNYFKKVKVDTIILGGDLMDFYQMSDFEKDPEERISTWEELRMCMGFLTDLRNNFPDAAIIFKIGNHDERFERWLRKHPEVADFPILNFNYLFNLHGVTDDERELAKKRNIEIVTKKRVMKMGKLNLVHGHEFGKAIFSPVNPARGLYLRAKSNTICGHHHQTTEHVEKDLNDNIIGCWTAGCLSDLHPAYQPINKYNLGFSRVTVYQDGNFSVENKKIMGYEIV